MKLADVYKLPTTTIPVTDYVMSERWLPEVPSWQEYFDFGEVLEAIEQEGLLKINRILFKNYDGERYAAMYSLLFKGSPVALIQEAGRSGRDHFNRWVTAPVLFSEMCFYLVSKFHPAPASDTADAEKEIYPEEVFHFYGEYFGDEFGIPMEPRAKGILLMPGHRLLPNLGPDSVLVTATKKYNVMPEYIRRGCAILKKVRSLNEEDFAINPRIRETSLADNHPNMYLYAPAELPINTTVLSV